VTELKLGSQGDAVFHWYDWAFANFKAYNFLLGKRDGYYGNDEAAFTKEMQRRLGLPQTGKFTDLEAARTGYKWGGHNHATASAHAPTDLDVHHARQRRTRQRRTTIRGRRTVPQHPEHQPPVGRLPHRRLPRTDGRRPRLQLHRRVQHGRRPNCAD
jgi:hypothetical protein